MENKTNLIGINGKIGSGKDTIGKIMQFLTRDYVYIDYSFDQYFNLNTTKHWEIKKYAYKLKQIAGILTGISVEDFEKQEVKDSFLGKEWNKEVEIYAGIPPFDNDVSTNVKQPYKIRELLQNIGTNAMRNNVHENIWVNALFADYRENINGDFIPELNLGLPNWIITDVRFLNEVEAIKKRNGIIIRVNRLQLIPRDFEHLSETALDNYDDFDYIIDNNSSIEDLIEQVKRILKAEFIID